MYTLYTNPRTKKSGQYGAEIYTVDDDNDVKVIVGVSHNGSTLTSTTKVISQADYADIYDLYDIYNEFAYHDALMSFINFK